MLIVALFWNGIVSVFVFGGADGAGWFGRLFILPFVAVGLGLIAGAVYQLLALFNPRPTLELSSSIVPLGGVAELRWSFTGRTSRIREFAVTLRGVEEARYRRGTDTCTDRNTFYEMELIRTADGNEIAAGQVGFVMPQDTMHSFAAENNKVLWQLDIHAPFSVGGREGIVSDHRHADDGLRRLAHRFSEYSDMGKLDITLRGDKTTFRPRDTIAGRWVNGLWTATRVLWSCRCSQIHGGKGTGCRCGPDHETRRAGSYGGKDFSFTLPGGPTASGKLISLIWAELTCSPGVDRPAGDHRPQADGRSSGQYPRVTRCFSFALGQRR
jgi:hypothetical protein